METTFTAFALKMILKQRQRGITGVVGITVNPNLNGLDMRSRLDYPKVFANYRP